MDRITLRGRSRLRLPWGKPRRARYAAAVRRERGCRDRPARRGFERRPGRHARLRHAARSHRHGGREHVVRTLGAIGKRRAGCRILGPSSGAGRSDDRKTRFAGRRDAGGNPRPREYAPPVSHRAYLSLGANLGEPAQTVVRAFVALGRIGTVVERSRLYRSQPWGSTDQPEFVNAAALLETDRTPRELLHELQSIETSLGRKPRERWGPRELDLDILTYDDDAIDEPGASRSSPPHARTRIRPGPAGGNRSCLRSVCATRFRRPNAPALRRWKNRCHDAAAERRLSNVQLERRCGNRALRRDRDAPIGKRNSTVT